MKGVLQMTKEYYLKVYNKGVELKDTDINSIVYGGLAPESYFFDFTLNFFFECGYKGYEFPQYVQGWRYGNIPESGQSYNFRDQKPEQGVSVMEVYGLKNGVVDKISLMFIGAQDRGVVKVEGYLNPFAYGSDGEYLLVDAKEVNND